MLHAYEELYALVESALTHAGASPDQAQATAQALVTAEASGLPSHGLSRVSMYVGHLLAGRVVGDAVPVIKNQRGGAVLIDAENGFAVFLTDWCFFVCFWCGCACVNSK